MPITLEQIVSETAQWPDEAVSTLMERISLARHDEADETHAEAWNATIHRRYEEIKNGSVAMIPMDEADAMVRKTVGL